MIRAITAEMQPSAFLLRIKEGRKKKREQTEGLNPSCLFSLKMIIDFQNIANDKVLFTLAFAAPIFGRSSGIFPCKNRAHPPEAL